MTLPALPTVPATVYAPGTEVESADLNDFETFMAALKVFVEAGLFTRPALADDSPVIATTDRDGRIRNFTDPNGYWCGPAVQQQYLWGPVNSGGDAAHGTVIGPPHLSAKAISGGLVRIMTPSASAPALGASRARLRILSGGTQDEAGITAINGANGSMIGDLDDQCIVMEVDASLVGNHQQIGAYIGLHEDGYSGGYSAAGFNETNRAFAHFKADYNSPATSVVWQCAAGDGSAITTVSTSISTNMTEFSTFRIEYHGANTPVGVANATAPVVRFFIDGARVAEITSANVPRNADAAKGISPGVSVGSVAGASGQVDFWVGPMKLAFSTRLAGNIPA